MAVANGKQQNNDGAFGFDVAITRSLNNKKPISLDMSEDFKRLKNVTSNLKTRKRRIINDEDDSTFTITVDNKTFHFQAKDSEEREKWIRVLGL